MSDLSEVKVSWGSYEMRFLGLTMEESIRRFAARVPLTQETTVEAEYTDRPQVLYRCHVTPKTVYEIEGLRGEGSDE